MKFCNFYELEGEYANIVRVGILHDGLIRPVQPLLPEHNWLEEAYGRPQGIGFDYIQNTVLDLGEWQRGLFGLGTARLDAAPGFVPEAVGFLPPVYPISTLRDSYCFEEHVRNARAKRGLEVAPEWYEAPVYYFSNPNSILGHDEDVDVPRLGQWLDFECEIACIIGQQGENIPLEDAENFIAGYTILNDWSLRDIQRKEMAVGLGPSKGKDFASTLGPYLVTPDELEDARDGKGFNLKTAVRINGKEVSSNNWNTINFSFGEMIHRFSQNAALFPGDVIGSGTVGRGCLLEIGPQPEICKGVDGWLGPGDVVELEIERLGILRNRIVPQPEDAERY
jgi:2-keto-4-pentenoate hydratase/2-oxohepta-3-ene-1,7-dioic acid hydratase in catechol pathway